MAFKKTVNGYEFDYELEYTASAPLKWKTPFLDATFECSATVELTKAPVMAFAKNWWVSYVQVILQDGIFLHYGGKEVYVIKPFGDKPKDMDATQVKINPKISLFDVRPSSTQPLSLATDLTADHMQALDIKEPKGIKKAVVKFSDSPALDTSKQYELYANGARTGKPIKLGMTTPDGKANLEKVYGNTRFGLWLVLMMNPTMQEVPADYQPLFGDLPRVPLGPQGKDDFHPLYYWEWNVDWTSNADAATGMITSRGDGMKVLIKDQNSGNVLPQFGNSPPATAVMGAQKL
jgi:hypothetical protein